MSNAAKYCEIIADNLNKAGWSLGYVSAIDSNGRTIWKVVGDCFVNVLVASKKASQTNWTTSHGKSDSRSRWARKTAKCYCHEISK
jgi:hypothetical protein